MTRLLHIASSPRYAHSHSRTLTQEFIDKWSLYHPEATVILRDLTLNPVPYLDDTWITAKFTAPDQYTPELTGAIELSDQLVDEFLAADCYIISAPMYNFTIPAVLKSYIDYIVRPRRTFAVENGAFKGLVTGKSSCLSLHAAVIFVLVQPLRLQIFKSRICEPFSGSSVSQKFSSSMPTV